MVLRTNFLFATWDSQVTPWNAVKMGPHRDITGQLEKAIKRRGLKFITTFHHGFAWRYFEPSFAFDGADRKYALLYTDAHKPGALPSAVFQDRWLAMVDTKALPTRVCFQDSRGGSQTIARRPVAVERGSRGQRVHGNHGKILKLPTLQVGGQIKTEFVDCYSKPLRGRWNELA